ncbi:hypothetical protein EZV62_025475 [Acer yangbiense]|uniref:Major facilitator superfamily (MFS) profile domain-containing protein n=1 Tax=Acer yangbiense TaxID=1000413 RepID=A0A5C7GXZ5_9ROSI|nr:hypothetical protein EZV62_025475 [Acer yangbiense]
MAQSHENIPPKITESHDDAPGTVASALEINESHDVITSSFEEMLERNLQGFGWAMFFQVILIALSAFFDSQQTFISNYTDGIPAWHCTNNARTTCNPKQSADICKLHTSEWAWDEIPSKTIVSEWGLQCSNVFLRGLPASSHFAGTLLGLFVLASLADSCLGRKKLLLYSCLTMSVTGILTILSNSVWIYSLSRFIAGFCRATMATSGIILLSEVVGKQWRGRVGTLLFSYFMLASGVSSVMIAVVGEKLKMIQITLSLATFLCADTALNLILVYSVEMFPTCVRNFAASLARQAVTFGAVLGSLLNSLGSKNPYLSYGVFGLIVFCCGFFVLILPETRGTSLCDTMDEQERKENIVHS